MERSKTSHNFTVLLYFLLESFKNNFMHYLHNCDLFHLTIMGEFFGREIPTPPFMWTGPHKGPYKGTEEWA